MYEIRVSKEHASSGAPYLVVTGQTGFSPWLTRQALEAKFGRALYTGTENSSLRVYCPRAYEWQVFAQDVETVLRQEFSDCDVVWGVPNAE